MSNSPHQNQFNLLEQPVASTLKKMTIPMVYGMALLMTFNLVDTFFVSLLGTQPLAAISFTFPITFTVISLSIGLGIGTSAVIARLLGAGEHCSARLSATTALLLAAVIVAGIAVIGFYFTDSIFLALGASQATLVLIHQYMDIWFMGSVCLIGPIIGNSVLRSAGDTKTPSMVMASAGLINAILDPLLIFGLGPIPALGLQGAAMATFISWLCGTALVLYIVGWQRHLLQTKNFTVSTFYHASKNILVIGFPAAGANMLTPIATAILTAIVARYGDHAVAAFGVGSRIESIACLVILALSMTLPPFISQNLGAGFMDRVNRAYQVAAKFVMIWQAGIYLLLIACAPVIAKVFAKDEQVADIIVLFIWVLPLGYGLQGIIILTNSSLNALHKPIAALLLSVIRLFVCYLPLAYLGSFLYDIEGFFLGALVGNIVMAHISYHFFVNQFRPAKVASSIK